MKRLVLAVALLAGCGDGPRAACLEVGGAWLTDHGSHWTSGDDRTACYEPPVRIRVIHVRDTAGVAP